MRQLHLGEVVLDRRDPVDRRAVRHLTVRHPSVAPDVPSPLRLYGARVVLRPLTAGDFAEWTEVRRRNERGSRRGSLAGRRPRSTPRSTATPSLARCTARDRDRGRRARRTRSGCSSTIASPARSTSTTSSAARCRAPTIGYWIDQARAGQSLIAEGVVVAARFAFDQLHLHRLEICIVPRNPNSHRVMEKLAAPRGRRWRSAFLEINGVWEDHVRYGFTAEEWAARRAELAAAWL